MTVRVKSHIVGQIFSIRDQDLAGGGGAGARGAVHVDDLPEWLVHSLALEHRQQ